MKKIFCVFLSVVILSLSFNVMAFADDLSADSVDIQVEEDGFITINGNCNLSGFGKDATSSISFTVTNDMYNGDIAQYYFQDIGPDNPLKYFGQIEVASNGSFSTQFQIIDCDKVYNFQFTDAHGNSFSVTQNFEPDALAMFNNIKTRNSLIDMELFLQSYKTVFNLNLEGYNNLDEERRNEITSEILDISASNIEELEEKISMVISQTGLPASVKWNLLISSFIDGYPSEYYNSLDLTSCNINEKLQPGMVEKVDGMRIIADVSLTDSNRDLWTWEVCEEQGEKYIYHQASNTGVTDANNASVQNPNGRMFLNSGNGSNTSTMMGSESYEKIGFQIDFKYDKPETDVGFFTKLSSAPNSLVNDPGMFYFYDANGQDYFSNNTVAIANFGVSTTYGMYQNNKFMLNYRNPSVFGYDSFDEGKALLFDKWYTLRVLISPKTGVVNYMVLDKSLNVLYSDSFISTVAFDSVSSLMHIRGSKGLDTNYRNAFVGAEMFSLKALPQITENNGFITAKLNIANDSYGGHSVLKGYNKTSPILILAVYDEQGKLLDVKSHSKLINTNTQSYGASPTYEELSVVLKTVNSGKYIAKAFVFKNMNSIIPYCESVVETLNVTQIMDNSIVLKSGNSTYFRDQASDVLMFDNKEYVPLDADGEMYIPVETMEDVLSVELSFDNTNSKLSIIGDENIDDLVIETPVNTDITTLLPLSDVANHLGYQVTNNNDIWIMSKNEALNNPSPEIIYNAASLFNNVIFNENFDSSTNQMNFKTWDGDNASHGIRQDNDTLNNCVYMNVTSKGFEGYLTPNISRGDHFDKNVSTYRLSFSYKVTEDFENSKLDVGLFFEEDNVHSRYETIENIDIETKGQWCKADVVISSENAPMVKRGFDHNGFKIIIRNSPQTSNNTVKGTIFIDNVLLTSVNSTESVVDAHMVADKYAAWYTLGDVVTYKPKYTQVLEGTKTVTMSVYDSLGNVVHTDTLQAEEVIRVGMSYTPESNGWYEAEFTAVMNDGRTLPVVIARSYKESGTNELDYYNLLRTSFYVTKDGTKPLSERNETLYFSSSTTNISNDFDSDFLNMADNLGFSGNRKVFINWGDVPANDGGTKRGVESTKGVYDWSQFDKYFEWLEAKGFENSIVCLMATPRWAAPDESTMTDKYGEPVSATKVTSNGMYVYNCYLPVDMNDWKNFLTAAVNRYKDKVDVWEIWNEPMDAKSAFWYDTPENYNDFLTVAYDTIKSIDADALVSTGGMGNENKYVRFLTKMIEDDPGVLDKMDYYASHGYYDCISRIKETIADASHAPIDWICTEGYYAFRTPTMSSNLQSSRLILNYLMQYKHDAKITTYFDIFNLSYEVEDIERRNTEHDYAVFRYFPYLMPKQAAATMHTFFELMEKDFSIHSEYEFGNKWLWNDNRLKGVLCNNGDKKMLILWQPNKEQGSIPQELLNCMNSSGNIVMMDGKITNNNIIPAEQIVYLTDIDANKLANYKTPTNDTALNDSYKSNIFECLSE